MTFIHWETELGMKGMEAEISLAFLKQDSWKYLPTHTTQVWKIPMENLHLEQSSVSHIPQASFTASSFLPGLVLIPRSLSAQSGLALHMQLPARYDNCKMPLLADDRSAVSLIFSLKIFKQNPEALARPKATGPQHTFNFLPACSQELYQQRSSLSSLSSENSDMRCVQFWDSSCRKRLARYGCTATGSKTQTCHHFYRCPRAILTSMTFLIPQPCRKIWELGLSRVSKSAAVAFEILPLVDPLF